MIAIIDYGMGNLRSVQKALERVGAQTCITEKRSDIQAADKLVLPGVGAIRPAMERLHSLDLITAIHDFVASGKPFLGICLGYQLLFENSYEGGHIPCLGFLKGTVEKFSSLKIPHMGWNQLIFQKPACPLLNDVTNGSYVYFCHSYYVKPTEKEFVLTTTPYGIDFASSIWKDNLYGTQFHPEKSQTIGLQIIKNFAESAS